VRKKSPPGFHLVLRLPGAEPIGQRAPEPIEPCVTHFEDAADIGGLGPVEKLRCFCGIGVARTGAFQHAQSHQRIEKIPRASRMDSKALAQRLAIERTFAKFGKESEFDSAKERLRSPEPSTELQDLRRRHSPLGHSIAPSLFICSIHDRAQVSDLLLEGLGSPERLPILLPDLHRP
jgi:hypothetical protein